MDLITLSNGKKTTRAELREYFGMVMEAEQSGEDFPVDLDHVWHFAYKNKWNAKRALQESDMFFEGQDYHILNSEDMVKRMQGGGIQPEKIYLSVSCLEFLIARKVRDIFEIYRLCRQYLMKNRSARLPYHIRRYITNYDQIPHGYFSILQQMTMQLTAPLEVQGYTLPENMLPDVSEGKLFCQWLRKEKGLDLSSYPEVRTHFVNCCVT